MILSYSGIAVHDSIDNSQWKRVIGGQEDMVCEHDLIGDIEGHD